MSLVQEAYGRLYPESNYPFTASIKYSNRFSDFNANVKKLNNNLEFNLSKKWKGVNNEILIGLIQELLIKILNKKDGKNSSNIQLYNNFIRNLHISASKDEIEPVISESFDRNNKKFFFNLIEKPNLVWGSSSFTKLATYDYHTDTISVSKILKSVDQQLLDYVIYHEMLHKSLKFSSKTQKTIHHSKEFKEKEKEFPNSDLMEKELVRLANKSKISLFA